MCQRVYWGLNSAWHDADGDLLIKKLEVKSPAVTGWKDNADKARADSENVRDHVRLDRNV
jgi:hypothetical protein